MMAECSDVESNQSNHETITADHETVSVTVSDAGNADSVKTSCQEDVNSVTHSSAAVTQAAEPISITTTNTVVQSDRKITAANEPARGHLAPTRQVSLSSPLPSLVNSLRTSAVIAMKRTRQTLSEKLGRGTRTVDAELEARVESLRIVQKRYSDVMQLARSFSAHFGALVACQQALATEFSDLAQKMPELHSEFAYNAETQRALHKNGETLLGALSFFTSTLHTLCYKTIEDTLLTIAQYEDARLEYDAYRSDVESCGSNVPHELQQSYQQHKEKFEQLRQILDIKMKFLDENKVKVMHQQLVLFHNAIAAYFVGNQTALDETLKQFSIKLKSPNAGIPSWLENQD